MSEENREKEIISLIKMYHAGYPFESSSWNNKLWAYYSVFYDIQCDYISYPEVLELFCLGVKPLALPIHGSVTGNLLGLPFGSNQPEQENDRVNSLLQALTERLQDTYPGFKFEPIIGKKDTAQ